VLLQKIICNWIHAEGCKMMTELFCWIWWSRIAIATSENKRERGAESLCGTSADSWSPRF